MFNSPLRRREAETIAAIAALYLLFWIILPKPAFWGVDSGIKYQSMCAFAETGSMTIPSGGDAGLKVDPQYRAFPLPFALEAKGGSIPVYSPVFIILGGVLLKVFGAWGPYLLSLLGGWGVLLGAWMLWIRHRSSHDARLYLIIIGLGSPLLFYSLELWEHSIAAALATWSFVFIAEGRQEASNHDGRKGAFLSGILIGFAILFRVECSILVVLSLGLWRMTGRKRDTAFRYTMGIVSIFALGAIIGHWQGDAVIPLSIVSNYMMLKVRTIMDMITNRAQNFYSISVEGFAAESLSLLGLLPLAVIAIWGGWRREKNWWPYFLVLLSGVEAAYLYFGIRSGNPTAHTADSGGLLWVAPIAGLAIMPLRGERRRFWRVVWLTGMSFMLGLALFGPKLDGIHWGPRLALPVIPLLFLLAATRAQRWWDKHPGARPVIIFLVAASVLNQFYSVWLLSDERNRNAELNTWVAAKSNVVLTDLWWMAGDCGTASYQHPWYYTKNGKAMEAVLSSLRDQSVKRISFLELPEYIPDEVWRKYGAQPVSEDYFLGRGGRLRLRVLDVVPSGKPLSTD